MVAFFAAMEVQLYRHFIKYINVFLHINMNVYIEIEIMCQITLMVFIIIITCVTRSYQRNTNAMKGHTARKNILPMPNMEILPIKELI